MDYKNKNIIAYIDASNLRFWILEDNWSLNYKSFCSWLRDKFWVNKAVLFSIISPNKKYLSYLLKKTGVPIINLKDFRHKLAKK